MGGPLERSTWEDDLEGLLWVWRTAQEDYKSVQLGRKVLEDSLGGWLERKA